MLSAFDFILSATIVGSYNKSKNDESIGDIDIVIIVKKLNKLKFNSIVNRFLNFDKKKIGLDKYHIKVNSTFGPLKLKVKNDLIFHVMIYDLKYHIDHVEKSPFTCYEWEKNEPIIGKSLKNLYPVVFVQISDILKSRRSIETYLNDLKNKNISYRKYLFKNDTYQITNETYILNDKNKYEYCFHITKHLLINLFKILNQKNITPSHEKIMDYFSKWIILKTSLKIYEDLYIYKNKNIKIPKKIYSRTLYFITQIFDFTLSVQEKIKKIKIFRHSKTKLNNKTFLGSSRNPSIITNPIFKDDFIYDIGFSSELNRSTQTLSLFNCIKIEKCSLLNEIDYGNAEGLKLKELEKKFPDIIKSWNKKLDPKFPNGENQHDVLNRINLFINKKIDNKSNFIIVTHLVVLRMILKSVFNLELHVCYKINIDHMEYLNFNLINNILIPNINSNFRTKLRKMLSNL